MQFHELACSSTQLFLCLSSSQELRNSCLFCVVLDTYYIILFSILYKSSFIQFLLLPFTRQEQCSGVRRKEIDAGMKRPGANLATITRSRPNLVSVSGPGQASLYDVVTPGEAEEDNLLGHNIYDATPDHSILKHGLAKSLSNFHLGESAPAGPCRPEATFERI